MAIEQRCPVCAPHSSRLRAETPKREPSDAGGSLTFTCRCGSTATVPTRSGPGRELARLGWTFQFVAD